MKTKKKNGVKQTRINASDVFIGGICLGCLLMSTRLASVLYHDDVLHAGVPCASQCLNNLLANNGYFQGGSNACLTEGSCCATLNVRA